MTCDKSGTLGQACGFAIVAQLVVMLLLSLILDGGVLAALCFICIIGHWLTILFVRIRRGKNPTKTDLVMARSGFMLYWVLLFAGILIYNFVK